MSRRDREERTERTRKVADYDRRVNEHTADRPSLVIPDGLKLWNPKKEGQYTVDLVPYEVSDLSKKYVKNYADPGYLYPERTYFTHRDIGVNQDSVVCNAKTFGTPCAVCEYRAELGKKPDKASVDLAKALFYKERQLFLVFDYDDQRKGLQLWDLSFHLFGKQLEAKLGRMTKDKRDKYKHYFDPDKGFTLVLGATEKPMPGGKPFLEFTVDEFNERDPLPDKLVDHGFNLDAIPNEMKYEELKKMLHGAEKEEDDKSDDRREPARGREREREEEPPARRSTTRVDTDDPPPRRTRDADDDAPRGRSREPEPSANGTAKFRVKDEVDFTYRNKAYTGVIVALDDAKEMAEIRVDGDDKSRFIDYDVMKPAAQKPDDDAPRRRARDDDEPAPRRSREPDPEPDPKPRARGRDDGWDDEPVKPRRRDEPDPEPAPRRGR